MLFAMVVDNLNSTVKQEYLRGDTFASTISLCLSLGIPIYNSVEIANYAAGIVVGKPGTQTVSAEELINSLNS